MTTSAHEVYQLLRHRYPNADVFVLDEEYDVPERSEVESLFSKFRRALKVHKLLKWTKLVWDCENIAWNFKGGTAGHRAATGAKREIPIGLLCYFENADEQRGHAINNAIWRSRVGSIIREIEPQGEGIKDLTKAERESAWLVIV